ncbi:MAG: amino acid ABC transporter permease [Geminicoccaceae bacterium]
MVRTRRVAAARRGQIMAVLQVALLGAALLWLVLRGASGMGYNWQWYRIPQFFGREVDGTWIWGPLSKGLVQTLYISALSFVLAMVLGLATALLRRGHSIVGRGIARAYVELIRNTPLLIQLYLVYFVIAPLVGLDRWWTAVVCLGLFEGAFAAEIFRAGLASVPKGQWEAGESLGLGRRDLYRYVVLPQALRLMLPPLTSLAVSLVKHSSLVSVIGVFELTTEGRNLVSDTYMSFEIWFTVAAVYLVVTTLMSAAAQGLERRLARSG